MVVKSLHKRNQQRFEALGYAVAETNVGLGLPPQALVQIQKERDHALQLRVVANGYVESF